MDLRSIFPEAFGKRLLRSKGYWMNYPGNGKAISPLISQLLLLVIGVAMASLAILGGMPYVEKLNETKNFEDSKQLLRLVDASITEIAATIGSTKELNFDLGDKKIDINRETDQIRIELVSTGDLVAEGIRFREKNLFYERTKNNLVVGLDYNGTGIDLNASLSFSRGLKRIELIDVNHSGGRAVIDFKVR